MLLVLSAVMIQGFCVEENMNYDVIRTDREVTGQCIRWQWYVFVIQRAEISGDTLEEGVHAGSQSMHVTVVDLVGEATQSRFTRLQTSDEFYTTPPVARI